MAALATTYFILSAVAGIFLAEYSLHLFRLPITPDRRAAVMNRARALHVTVEEATLRAQDGVVLRGWLFRPEKANGDAVIALHGVTDNRLGVAGYAEFLVRRGYTVLTPDSRAHGESGGQLATYGLLEREDVHAWADWLVHTTHPVCLYGFGGSMGAAIILQSVAVEHRYCAVVAESPFSDFRHAAVERVSRKVGLGLWAGNTIFRPMIDFSFLYARLRYGLDLGQVSPQEAVAHSDVPVLLIHGMDDVNLLPRNSERIHARSGANTELWEVKGAAHCGAWNTQPREFERRWLGWYAEHRTCVRCRVA